MEVGTASSFVFSYSFVSVVAWLAYGFLVLRIGGQKLSFLFGSFPPNYFSRLALPNNSLNLGLKLSLQKIIFSFIKSSRKL